MAEGAVISNLVDMLTEFLRDGVSPIWRVREQVEPLCVELKAIHCFLKDMDGKEGKDASVKNWLALVRDVAYEAEDLIDDFMIEGQKHAPFRAPMMYSSYGKGIEEIKSKISQLVELRTRYVSNLPNSSAGRIRTSPHVVSTWRRTSSFLNDDPVVGFEQHKCNLMEVLLSSNEKLNTIVITGMGGVGKTTLASVLYNEAQKVMGAPRTQVHLGSHPKESGTSIVPQKHFDCFAWVTVGLDPDIFTLFSILSAQVEDSYYDMGYIKDKFKSHGQIITYWNSMLLKFLSHRRYLIVLDDVWSPGVCTQLMQALPDMENGSRIILTSRQKDLPSAITTSSHEHELKALNEEESWQLFLNKAFPQSNQQNGRSCPKELEDLGHELCKRCYGLPLALVVLGGLVSRKDKHPAVWIELLESLHWVSTKDGRECLDILALSYCDLPHHLKPCFLYLGAFRPDSEISASKLTKVWAGDGLIPKMEGRTHEEVGFEYLEEFIQRCMVQAAIRGPDNRVKRIRIHALLSELALSEAKESNFLYVSRECHDKILVPESFHRRVAFHREVNFPIKNSSGKLRALLAFPRIVSSKKITIGGRVTKPYSFYRWAANLLDFPRLCFQPNRMMCVRVLELEGVRAKDYQIEFLEGSMVHLRYLGLRNTNLTEFPFSACNLQCLQTLDIRGTSIETLPDHIWTNKALEHLYLNLISPPDLTGLRGLQTLVGALCTERIARGLSNLTNLRYLKMQLIEISCGDEVVNSLRGLSNLMSLKLYGEKIPQEVIGETKYHQKLFKLNLKGKLQPNEIPAFEDLANYLTQLTLSGASLEQDPMSTLKQLRSLRVLKLKDNAYIGREIVCSSGGFFQLQYLKLSWLHCVMLFRVESKALPNLCRLSIHRCGQLDLDCMEQLTTLQALKLKEDVVFVPRNRQEVQDFCQSNNILLITKNNYC